MHREHCHELLKQTTKAGMRKMESSFGVRYSSLLSLPYFDPIRFIVIDIMHNMFLGTVKHISFKVWWDVQLISKGKLTEIERVEISDAQLSPKISDQYVFKLWWIHSIAVANLDNSVFPGCFVRNTTWWPFAVLVTICTCMFYSEQTYTEAEWCHYSWPAFGVFLQELWTALWKETLHSESTPTCSF